MLFPSEVFLFWFLPIVLIVYYLFLRRFTPAKNLFLLCASLFFYAFGEPKHLPILLFVIINSYFFGLLIHRFHKKAVLFLGIVFNLSVLGYFKYTDFLLSNSNRFFHTAFRLPDIALPIGISFFTFQALSYLIDVYRGKGEVQKNPFYLGLYISLFPQLIAGPIVRYETIEKEIRERKENLTDFCEGICRFILGMGKKMIFANAMGRVADVIFSAVFMKQFHASTIAAWLGAISYTLQIYFDFSGYSDMAIGLGRMFGFHFLENFNYPYLGKSVSEFWRRWHISLQTWFRDYVYYPLGGSRVGSWRLLFNLFVVWGLTGIWHGANWTFIGWGLLYFVLLSFEKFTGIGKKLENGQSATRFMGHFYTMFFVILGWVLFRSGTPGNAVTYVKAMFGLSGTGLYDGGVLRLLQENWYFYLLGIPACTPIFKNIYDGRKNNVLKNVVYVAVLSACLLLSVITILNDSYNPFIYFNF